MEKEFINFIHSLHLIYLFIIIGVTLYTLSKGADLFVDGAVALSEEFHISKIIIGATIVSLGTTIPEVSVSVMAALRGDSSLSLGNAVGSIICNTGLIIGISTLISPLRIQKKETIRQNWLQITAASILILISLPYTKPKLLLTGMGYISKGEGFFLLLLLFGYIYLSLKWIKKDRVENIIPKDAEDAVGNNFLIFTNLSLGIILVIISSKILIPTVQITAIRLHIPSSVIGATIVAFGTSLPELITSITAARKGHGELAIGNVTGANILNILFVIGSAAVFSKKGITVTPHFFILYFPSMLAILGIFSVGILINKKMIPRIFGFFILLIYITITIIGYGTDKLVI